MAGNHNQADNERNTANRPVRLMQNLGGQTKSIMVFSEVAYKMLNFGKRGKSEYPGENPLGAEQGTNKFNQNVVSNTE